MKIVALTLLCMVTAGCSKPPADASFCRAASAGEPTRELVVRGVYTYGTLEHGTLFIAPSCVRPVFAFGSFGDDVSQAAGTEDRIRKFNVAAYNSPKKAGGLFKLDAVVNVYPQSKTVELFDINEFEEVDYAEARPIVDLLRRDRGN